MELGPRLRGPAPTQLVIAATLGRTMEKYKIRRRLGGGGEGETYLAIKGFQKYALKLVDDYERAMREADKLAAAGDHSNVVTVFEVVSMAAVDGLAHLEHDHGVVVMQYVEGKTLQDALHEEGQLTPDRWRSILLPLLDGLRHIHDNGLIHRDIKPDNIMLLDGARPIFIDLGLAKRLGSTPTRYGGHRDYRPPEWRDVNNQDRTYDMYQLALVSYEALFGELLDDRDQMRGELQGHSSPFISSIGKALENSPTNRPRTVWDWVTSMISAPPSVAYSDDEHLAHFSGWSNSVESGLGATDTSVQSGEPDRRNTDDHFPDPRRGHSTRQSTDLPVNKSFGEATARITVKRLCDEIEKEFQLPSGSLTLCSSERSPASGQMRLRNLTMRHYPSRDYGEKTLEDLANRIGARFGLRSDRIEFRRGANDGRRGNGGFYFKQTKVKTLRKDYSA